VGGPLAARGGRAWAPPPPAAPRHPQPDPQRFRGPAIIARRWEKPAWPAAEGANAR